MCGVVHPCCRCLRVRRKGNTLQAPVIVSSPLLFPSPFCFYSVTIPSLLPSCLPRVLPTATCSFLLDYAACCTFSGGKNEALEALQVLQKRVIKLSGAGTKQPQNRKRWGKGKSQGLGLADGTGRKQVGLPSVYKGCRGWPGSLDRRSDRMPI